MKRILIVEDNTLLSENLAEVLALDDLRADCVRSAEEALTRVAENEYSAILTDLRLPGMSGVELLATLRRTQNRAPVILMTAFADKDATSRAEQLGALEVLFKPIDLGELLGLLRECTTDAAKVLVIDDNRAQAENLADALAIRGYDVETAASSSEALELKALPRLAIVDFRLPDGNGLDLALRLKARNPKLEVIMVSGYTQDAQAWIEHERGPALLRTFEKPAPVDELLGTVHAALAKPNDG